MKMTEREWDMLVLAALALVGGLILGALINAWDREAHYEREHRVIPPAVLDSYKGQQP